MTSGAAEGETAAPRARAPSIVGCVAIAALALWARSTQRALVFLGGETLPLDTDCHHHMRRALRTLASYPSVPQSDPFINWPEGASPPWGPGFDQLLALPAWIARLDASHAARWIAWVPPVLGVMVSLLALSLARAMEPDPAERRGASWSAGLIAAALPLAALTAMVGRTDHHVFEALVTGAVACWVLAARRASLRFELAGAALVFATVHTFSGAVLTWGLATAALLAPTLASAQAPRAPRDALLGSGAPALLGGALLLLVIDGGWIRAHGGAFHHLQLSYLQPTLLVTAAAALGVSALVAGRVRRDATLPRVATRIAVTTLLLAPIALLAAGLAPGAARGLRVGVLEWLATQDPWMRSIDESQPLLRVGARGLLNEYGLLAFAAPLLLPLGAWRASRRDLRAGATALMLGVGMVALTLLQRRFGRASTPTLAALCALGLVELFARLRRASPSLRLAPLGLTLAWVALDPSVREQLVPTRGPWILGVHEAALALRRGAPAAPRRGERAAVFAHWTQGHEVTWLAGRPVLVTGFGPYGSRATWAETEAAWTGDEARMLRVLDAHDAGFLMFPSNVFLAQRAPSGEGAVKRSSRGGLVVSAQFLREVPVAAALLGGTGAPSLGVAHLAQLRPIYAARGTIRGLASPVPTQWIYERVAGAVLTGEASDGVAVTASIPLLVHRAQRTWQASAVSHGGSWRITVPLPTSWQTRGGIATGPRYTIRAAARSAEVTVRDEATRRGEVVRVRFDETSPRAP